MPFRHKQSICTVPLTASYSEFWLAAIQPGKSFGNLRKLDRDVYPKIMLLVGSMRGSFILPLRAFGLILQGICTLHARELELLLRSLHSTYYLPSQPPTSPKRNRCILGVNKRRESMVDRSKELDIVGYLSELPNVDMIRRASAVNESGASVYSPTHPRDTLYDIFLPDHEAELFCTPLSPEVDGNARAFSLVCADVKKRRTPAMRIPPLVSGPTRSHLSLISHIVSGDYYPIKSTPACIGNRHHFLLSKKISLLGNLPVAYCSNYIDYSGNLLEHRDEQDDAESAIDILRDDQSIPEDAFGGFSRRASIASSRHVESPPHMKSADCESNILRFLCEASRDVPQNVILPKHMSRQAACRRFVYLLQISQDTALRFTGGQCFDNPFSVHTSLVTL